MEKDIKVSCISGIDVKDFLELNNLGYDVEIPDDSESLKIYALGEKPEDYIIIFTIYFSIKVVEGIANEIAKKLISDLPKIFKRIWSKHKDKKPAIVTSGKDPEYKQPKAILSFKISENESSTIEITNDINDSQLKQLLETQIELVSLQYKNRKTEQKIIDKMKKKK